MFTEKNKIKILLLCKEEKEIVNTAIKHLSNQLKDNLVVYKGQVGDSFPENLDQIDYDYLISFLSPWIVPERILNKARCGAINFHPAPPEYPGTGCFNFALYDNSATYGATCHHMEQAVDSGDVIAVKRFKVYNEDNVSTLIDKTYSYMLTLFYEIVDIILSGEELPLAKEESWKGKARTRKELNELCEIRFDMDKEEVERRIRATLFPNMPGPELKYCGYTFKLTAD